MPAHGQKTRLLKRPAAWHEPEDVSIEVGTGDNWNERFGNRYAWRRDKYIMRTRELAENPSLELRFEFKGAPDTHDLKLFVIGWYTGTHISPHAPRLELYDWVGTGWDNTGVSFQASQSAEEKLEYTIQISDSKYWQSGTNNIRCRLLHPPVVGNVTHELNICQVGLLPHYFTTTTTTTSTTSTTTTTV